MKVSSFMTLPSLFVFTYSHGVENQVNRLVNKIWASEDSFDSRIKCIGPT